MANVIALESAQAGYFKAIDEYPPTMQAKDVQEYLGISLAMAYNVLNSASCPTIRIGKRMIVRKESFMQFLENSEGKQIMQRR